MQPFLWAAPWLLFPLVVILVLRRKPHVRDFAPARSGPLVSIIVPARNEAVNVGRCVSSLLSASYTNREIIIVDDGSTDATGDIAHEIARRSRHAARVLRTGQLREGWVGKSWACWTGYRAARGDLLLFTDADTTHSPDLLAHAVGALQATRAGLVSLLPRQVMGSFWERVVLPHIFLGIMLRFPSSARVSRTRKPRHVIANGQFMLLTRSAYEAFGGHQAVRREVVEDLAMAQGLVRQGNRILLAHAEDLMETRMYRSLREITEGWSKNLALGVRLSMPPALGTIALWAAVPLGIVLWVLPPAILVAGVLLPSLAPYRWWAALATGGSLLGWLYTHLFMGSSIGAAVLYPLGGAVASFLVGRSALRGNRVEWRGRRYEV